MSETPVKFTRQSEDWIAGQNFGISQVCKSIDRILDGTDDGSGKAQEPWESTRRRLLILVGAPEATSGKMTHPQKK